MNKKIILTLASTALLTLAGCGSSAQSSKSASQNPSSIAASSGKSSETPSSESPSTPESSVEPSSEIDKTKISFWHNCNDTTGAVLNNFAERFETLNPDIDVEVLKQSGSYDDLRNIVITGLAADNYPDLFYGYPDSVSEILAVGKVVKLDKYMKDKTYGWTEDDWDDIIPAYIEEGQQYQVSGTYSLPFAKSTEAMYYRKDLIGIDLSNYDNTINNGDPLSVDYIENLTWEELFGKLCPALISYNEDLPDEKKIYDPEVENSAILGWSSDDNAFITLCEQYGIPYTGINKTTGKGEVLFNNPEAKALSKMFHEAHSKGYFVTSKTFNNQYTNDLFSAKGSLFDIGSTGGISHYPLTLEFSAAPIPTAAGKDKKVVTQGPSVAILDHDSKERAMATWRFYKFMTEQVQNDAFARTTGYSPIRYSVYLTEDWAEYQSYEGKTPKTLEYNQATVAQYIPKVSEDLFASPVFKGSSTCRTQVGGMFGTIIGLPEWNDDTVNQTFLDAENNSKLAC